MQENMEENINNPEEHKEKLNPVSGYSDIEIDPDKIKIKYQGAGEIKTEEREIIKDTSFYEKLRKRSKADWLKIGQEAMETVIARTKDLTDLSLADLTKEQDRLCNELRETLAEMKLRQLDGKSQES